MKFIWNNQFAAIYLALSVLLTPSASQAAAKQPMRPSSPDFPKLDIGKHEKGERAIQALGDQLPAVANAYALTGDQLKERFRGDRHLGVDRNGRLFFSDDFELPLAATASPQAAVAAATPFPLDQTFLLHSRPGALRVIYLDFDGHVLSGTAWNNSNNGGNPINCPAWDIDGNPAVFGDSERTVIQKVWQRVAEDYAPFDVDVTTEYMGEAVLTRSSSSDQNFGVRVLISAISSYFGNYGGIAYIGVFDDVGDTYKTPLVFPENLANGEKYIAEAASHEAGHTLGLYHDGTTTGASYYQGHGSGEVGWAPIMGAGYYENLTQWSKGEYANANNTQDDLTVITATGLSYRPDDHGNTAGTASYFPAGSTFSATGVIERNTDVDVFAFTCGAGPIAINVAPWANGPNLDIVALLYNSSGGLVASNNSSIQLAANINTTVAAGTYFLHVRGTGAGDPLATGYTGYASLGQYTVTGTVVSPSGPVPPVAVAAVNATSGTAPVTISFNGSGSFDQDGTIVSNSWNFGDGTSGSGASPSHTYVSAGNYTATLTVTDNSGLTDSDTVSIAVTAPNTAPVAVISATPTNGTAPRSVSFNGSGSYDTGGSIASYAWNFGDGTSGNGASISHTYVNAGNYTATLTVTDTFGLTGSKTVSITVTASNAAPVAVLSATTTNGIASLAVSFSGANSYDTDGSIASYAWNFGDGTSGNGVSVSHTYVNAGTYTATLTVTDNLGLTGSKSVSITATVPNVSPVAVLSATPTNGTVSLLVSFSGTSSYDTDGSIASYSWNFGDGTTGSGASVSHTYTSAGSYNAVLTVTDNRAATSTANKTITVQQATVPVMHVASIQLAVENIAGGKRVRATVNIVDANNNPVSGATVTGTWSGLTSGTSSGMTISNGSVVLRTGKFKKSGTVTFQVTGVTKSNCQYDSSKNAITQISLSATEMRVSQGLKAWSHAGH